MSDKVYEQVRKFFTEKELADLTLAVAAINSWNRLNIAARNVAGTYRPAKLSAASHLSATCTQSLLERRIATTREPLIEGA